ncbi:hypothetical protein ABT364_17165 [Massilia sp. SR12]
MTSMQPLWWYALPVLLLPVWWHMRKRERTRTDFLATARFLPSALPQQRRVLRWADVPLLLVRLALLVVLIAWLAVLAMPWKGDTVFVAAAVERSAWAEQQIAAAGMGSAARQSLPDDAWNWLARNEHEWRPEARFLILAPAAAMPALPPRLAHPIDLRLAATAPTTTAGPAPATAGRAATAPADPAAHAQAATAPTATSGPAPATAGRAATASADPAAYAQAATARLATAGPSATAPTTTAGPAAAATSPASAAAPKVAAARERQVVLVTSADRLPRWQALFAAFSTAADGAQRYVLTDAPTASTELIVWDKPDTQPPPSWQAKLWWRTAAANGQTQTPQGTVWTAPQWPLQDIDAARALYERWQAATARPTPHPLPAQQFRAEREKPLPTPLARSPEWLAIALLALFAIERTLTHVRRRS